MEKLLDIKKDTIVFEIENDKQNAFLEAFYTHKWHRDDYVFFPAACYNGNRFEVLKKDYPPMFGADEAAVDMALTITDIPRLNKDGSGEIALTTGDVSVPCIGVFSIHEQKGILLFTIQQVNGYNLGLTYYQGRLAISWPAKRNSIYRWPFMTSEKDKGADFVKGQIVEIPYKLVEFDCKTLEDFYSMFFKLRKCMGLNATRPKASLPSEIFAVQKEKFNKMNWQNTGGFYSCAVGNINEQLWQPGWVGGGISSYALMRLGGTTEQERAVKTLQHLFNTQAPSGFFYESTNGYGNVGSSFHKGDAESWCLVRKSADVLYFLFKHFEVMKNSGIDVMPEFEAGTKKLADAFVRLWQKYGQFGQFINLQSGDIAVGGSTSGAIIPAALVKAWQYFGDSKYLLTAKLAAQRYYFTDACKGVTTGAPGEILQCPDSESAFALLESFVLLYEETREQKWLEYAKHTANLSASWVMPYNYDFPIGTEFERLGMKTMGTVFANAQNKHSAPGICTLSGDSLYKLFLWTDEDAYLELLKDIALSISQYMSTEKRPIYSWALPKDPTLDENKNKKAEREVLPPGFICERVNTSDWEGAACIGGVFNASCWPETSLLLTLAEVMPLLQNDLSY